MAGRGKWDGLTGWTYTRLEMDALRQGLPPASGDGDEVWRDWFFEAAAAGSHDLTVGNLDTGAPTLDSPALTQGHALTVSALKTAAPTLDSPALGQRHELTVGDLATGTPDIGSPALTIVGSVPFKPSKHLAWARVTWTHDLAARDLSSGVPTLGKPALTTRPVSVALQARDLSTAPPMLGKPRARDNEDDVIAMLLMAA